MSRAGMHGRKRTRNDDPFSRRIAEMEEDLEEGLEERFSKDEFLDESLERLGDEYSENDLIAASLAGSPDTLPSGHAAKGSQDRPPPIPRGHIILY
ncbi:hypothetical protein BGZ52_011876, partial [Haplosporangium bisporale]